MGRAPCCDKANVKRGPWSPEEDATLKSYLESHGTGGNWIALPQKAGLRRCGKSCRLRWLNYLRPDIKHGGFTEEEDNVIISLFNNIGSRWSVIASHLPGRTDNDVKNYWNTKLKKRLAPPPLPQATGSSSSRRSSSIIQSPSPNSVSTLAPVIKIEDFSAAPAYDWTAAFGFGPESYHLFAELPPLPMPALGFKNQVETVNTTPENSSAASSSRGDDTFLSEMGFESYSELINGYGEVAKDLFQRVTY